ncbi:NAD(P)H-dependent oxidoreductase [Dysosmobacter sp.]|uniref:NAD(P)H-dependent oxidoreductase n=1 Tax=Dysosmobacter sp. TaxID=2591382 RepID=UPI003A8D43F1
MAQELTLICPGQGSERLSALLATALKERHYQRVSWLTDSLRNRRLLVAAAIPPSGVNLELYQFLAFLRTHPGCLEGSVGGVLVDGTGDLYTKAAGRELVLSASQAGCVFPGRPLVEATGSLRNFTVQAKNAGCGLEEAYRLAISDLMDRVTGFAPPKRQRPKLLVLHASSRATSNTLALWSRVRAHLEDRCHITEVGLRNGTMEDCAGCPYTTCLHFGEQGECFYGGVMVQEVYPAIREADAVVLLCPNYNDALSANLSACINRLTALYRTTSFADKAVFAIVVSGYSGGDIVARQVVSALNMNKGFWLPDRFCMLETANDKGEAMALPGIGERAEQFARIILRQLTV